MRPNTATKYSWFLIFLTLGQEFTAAYRINAGSWPVSHQYDSSVDSIDPLHLDPKLHPEYFNGDYLLEELDREAMMDVSAGNESDTTFVQPVKRGWGTLLARAAAVALGLSVGATLANVGVQLWIKLRKCCGSGYQALCDTEREIKKIQDHLVVAFDNFDFGALTAKNLLEDIRQTNYRINEIWLDMKRITSAQDRFLHQLGLIKEFNKKWSEIEGQLRHANNTYRKMSFQKLTFQFSSIFDTVKGTLLGVAGIAFLGLQAAGSYAWKRYTQRKLDKKVNNFVDSTAYRELATARHTKAAKILGVNKVGMNAHIRETVISRQKKRFDARAFTHVLNGVTIISSGVSIYFDVISIMNAFKQCSDMLSRAKELLTKAKKAKRITAGVQKNLTDYITFIDAKGFKYVKGQLTGPAFLKELENVRKLAKAAGQQSKNMTKAAEAMDDFIMGINDANAKKTMELATKLADGLGRIKFLYSCYTNKIKLINFVKGKCRNGTKTLKELYVEATGYFNTGGKVNDNTCKNWIGVPYYSFANMEAEWKITAKREKLSTDCILNSSKKKEDACRKRYKDGEKVSKIAKDLKLSIPQVEKLTANCPVEPLTPTEKGQICELRNDFKWSDKRIARFMKKPLPQIQGHKCKKP